MHQLCRKFASFARHATKAAWTTTTNLPLCSTLGGLLTYFRSQYSRTAFSRICKGIRKCFKMAGVRGERKLISWQDNIDRTLNITTLWVTDVNLPPLGQFTWKYKNSTTSKRQSVPQRNLPPATASFISYFKEFSNAGSFSLNRYKVRRCN